MLHMRTAIEGHLKATTSVVALVEALHPTPAVGGVPRAFAMDFIARNEANGRGWYSAPFGWVDAEGDGDFIVALRSGLVRGPNAWAWAGGGIVAGSEAASEYAESALKLGPMLSALGEGDTKRT